MSSPHGIIIEIGDILVSEEVITEFFACDYKVCRGACCIIGDSGAPLLEEELDPVEAAYPSAAPLMTEKGRGVIASTGFFSIDRDGDLVTPTVPGSEECAYAHFAPDGSCLCALEMAHLKGSCSFRKPRSCSLYPIRVTELAPGRLALNYHRWDICKAAVEKGRKENTRVFQFLKGPLTEYFGEEFYSALSEAATRLFAVS